MTYTIERVSLETFFNLNNKNRRILQGMIIVIRIENCMTRSFLSWNHKKIKPRFSKTLGLGKDFKI